MSTPVARITDVLVDLNQAVNVLTDNDTLEFNIDKRLDVLETVVDDLVTQIEITTEFSKDTSE